MLISSTSLKLKNSALQKKMSREREDESQIGQKMLAKDTSEYTQKS